MLIATCMKTSHLYMVRPAYPFGLQACNDSGEDADGDDDNYDDDNDDDDNDDDDDDDDDEVRPTWTALPTKSCH